MFFCSWASKMSDVEEGNAQFVTASEPVYDVKHHLS